MSLKKIFIVVLIMSSILFLILIVIGSFSRKSVNNFNIRNEVKLKISRKNEVKKQLETFSQLTDELDKLHFLVKLTHEYQEDAEEAIPLILKYQYSDLPIEYTSIESSLIRSKYYWFDFNRKTNTTSPQKEAIGMLARIGTPQAVDILIEMLPTIMQKPWYEFSDIMSYFRIVRDLRLFMSLLDISEVYINYPQETMNILFSDLLIMNSCLSFPDLLALDKRVYAKLKSIPHFGNEPLNEKKLNYAIDQMFHQLSAQFRESIQEDREKTYEDLKKVLGEDVPKNPNEWFEYIKAKFDE